MQKKTISLLGSTGSIGSQSLSVCENMGYRVAALAGYANTALLEEQARRWNPTMVVVADETRYTDMKTALADTSIRVEAGPDALCEAAALEEIDTVLNAVVGIAGLRPTLAALEAGKTLALANKESLVTGGALVTQTARDRGVAILPVDSEHSAILQCMSPERRREMRGVILTASGGPFFGKTREELRHITVEQALNHPNWSMGRKITVDSATLMNKGLEFIEAMWLFDLKPEDIQVVVHRQSVVHSAVEYADGSVIAQLGVPDMRCAIQYAFTYPHHKPLDMERLSLSKYASLTFADPDPDTFRCLAVCIQAAHTGGLAPAVANGANEAAVALFLEGKIPFLGIGDLVEQAVAHISPSAPVTLENIQAADQAARDFVASHL